MAGAHTVSHLLAISRPMSIYVVSQNGYEVLPLYIGAVLAATYSELDNYTVNIACSVL